MKIPLPHFGFTDFWIFRMCGMVSSASGYGMYTCMHFVQSPAWYACPKIPPAGRARIPRAGSRDPGSAAGMGMDGGIPPGSRDPDRTMK